jgi:hypothetical protein
MILAWLLLLTGLTISAVAIYYSVVGLTAIFSAAAIPIIIMGSALEVGKLVCASWLKANWERAPRFIKYYMVIAVVVLMIITSMGIFGFLSKAHSDQSLVSGDVGSKIAIYDEKIKTSKDNIDANRKALKQMDEAVDQVMGRSSDEKGAEKAVQIRRSQQKERARLQSEITAEQKTIAAVSEERAPIAAEVRKVEAEVGPIKYIAKFIYGDAGADENMLEKAVTWIIILIVVVFDPLAVIMLLAAQMTFGWRKQPSISDFVPQPTELVVDNELHEWAGKYYAGAGPVPNEIKTTYSNITQEELDALLKPDNEQTHTEEVPSETQPTALGGDITAPEEKLVETVEDVPLEQWNKMIEEAEQALAKEQGSLVEKEARRYSTEFPTSPKEGDTFTRTDFEPPREFTFNGSQWVDSESFARYKPDFTEVVESEESKKKTYMMKTGDRQITKSR